MKEIQNRSGLPIHSVRRPGEITKNEGEKA